MLERLLQHLYTRPLWRVAFTVIAGVLFAFGFADFDLPLLALIGLAMIFSLFAIETRRRHAFFLGWGWGTVVWLINVPWVIPVMSKYGGLPKPVGIAIFILMAIYVGINGAILGVLVQHLVRRRFGWALLPLAWAAEEFFRARFLPSFPWNPTAVMLIEHPILVIPTQLVGPFFAAAVFASIPALLAWLFVERPIRPIAGLAAGCVVTLIIVWLLIGWTLLEHENGRIRNEPKQNAALLQPNITQEQRWDSTQHLALFQKVISMTEESLAHGATTVIWPESTVPWTFTTTDFFRGTIEDLSAQYNADIILGSVAQDDVDERKVWNAAYLIANGTTKGRYDKIRLVPFGEYVPFRKLFFFAGTLVRNVGEFQRGTNERPLAGRNAYGPAICYEIVFPEITATQVRNGATVLVTITNDAWFDRTSAPAQHLNMARLRAVEANRYLLRAATTGISAAVDPAGRVIDSLPLFTEGTIYARFAQRTSITPYVRFGDWFGFTALAVVVLFLFQKRRSE